MAITEIRPHKVWILNYEIYRYVHQHRMTVDEMLQATDDAYHRLIKEGYVARDEISDAVLRGQCTLTGDKIEGS